MSNQSPIAFSWDFSQGLQNWQGGFADYPQGEENFYELDFGLNPLPNNLGGELALFITSNNHSEDEYRTYASTLYIAYWCVFRDQFGRS